MESNWESSPCILCDVVEGEPWVPYCVLFPSKGANAQILLNTPSFVVVPDIAPIVEGYCLILSKRHIFAMTDLSEQEFLELKILKNCVKKVLFEIYHEQVIAFEHGELSPARNAGACIDHSHLHIVPAGVSLLSQMTDFKFFMTQEDNLRTQIPPNNAYLYYEDVNKKFYYALVNHCEQQFFRRKLVATMKQKINWNWRDYIRYADELDVRNKITNCIDKVKPLLQTEWKIQNPN